MLSCVCVCACVHLCGGGKAGQGGYPNAGGWARYATPSLCLYMHTHTHTHAHTHTTNTNTTRSRQRANVHTRASTCSHFRANTYTRRAVQRHTQVHWFQKGIPFREASGREWKLRHRTRMLPAAAPHPRVVRAGQAPHWPASSLQPLSLYHLPLARFRPSEHSPKARNSPMRVSLFGIQFERTFHHPIQSWELIIMPNSRSWRSTIKNKNPSPLCTVASPGPAS